MGIEARFTKTFASATVDVELAFAAPRERGHVVVLFGPSGCGKTTVLRALAGLERPGAGHIHAVHLSSREVWLDAARGVCVAPQRRDIGFLAQGLALFPHLNVAGNVGFGLAGLAAAEREQRCVEVLRLLRIEELATRMPASLSGGQAQRVALARTLAPRPRLLLLDEPLSALDAPTRIALRRDLRVVLVATQTLAVLVTHDRDEAIALGDEVVVMSHGRVLQSGPVLEVFGRPRTSEVARVVGMDTVVAGRVIEVNAGLVVAQVGAVRIEGVAAGIGVGNEVAVCIRAESVSLAQGAQGERSSGRNRLRGKVMTIEPEGSLRRVTVDVGFPLAAFITQQSLDDLALTPGDDVTACIKAAQVHVVARS